MQQLSSCFFQFLAGLLLNRCQCLALVRQLFRVSEVKQCKETVKERLVTTLDRGWFRVDHRLESLDFQGFVREMGLERAELCFQFGNLGLVHVFHPAQFLVEALRLGKAATSTCQGECVVFTLTLANKIEVLLELVTLLFVLQELGLCALSLAVDAGTLHIQRVKFAFKRLDFRVSNLQGLLHGLDLVLHLALCLRGQLSGVLGLILQDETLFTKIVKLLLQVR